MTGGDSPPLMRVLGGLLRPLVRLLIARGVTAPALYRLLKTLYVEVAHRDFRIADAPPTDSRITLLTGVHRRDVRTILSDPGSGWAEARARAATFSTVLGRWRADPAFRDADGAPRALPRSGTDGSDFEALVAGVSRDIRPRTVLDEMLRQDLVTEGPDGLLRLADDAVAGPRSDDHRLVFFAANVGDHLAAAVANLDADDAPMLERAVFYNRMTPEDVAEVEARARVLSSATLEELNALSAERQRAGADRPDARARYRYGVYFFREPPDPAAGDGGSHP